MPIDAVIFDMDSSAAFRFLSVWAPILLALLDSRGVAKAVATSTERGLAVAQLGGLDLLDRFSVLATGDEVANGKPAR